MTTDLHRDPATGNLNSPAFHRLLLLFGLSVFLSGVNTSAAATNDVFPFRTNFVRGAELSISELESVAKLAHTCGISNITDVSTEVHLSGLTILVAGDDTSEGRTVDFKTLRIYRIDNRHAPKVGAPSVDKFWAAAAPEHEARTNVQVGDRQVRVGLLNGIKPEGADKICEAFAKGKIRIENELLKDALSEVDVLQPTSIGISGGQLSISFRPRERGLPLTQYMFKMNGDEITLVDRIRLYE